MVGDVAVGAGDYPPDGRRRVRRESVGRRRITDPRRAGQLDLVRTGRKIGDHIGLGGGRFVRRIVAEHVRPGPTSEQVDAVAAFQRLVAAAIPLFMMI